MSVTTESGCRGRQARPGFAIPFWLTAAIAPASWPASAQEASPARVHVGHVGESFPGVPDGMGLLAAARVEAEVAARHAGLAAAGPSDLASVRRHAAHVMHALDPGRTDGGPGRGYGLVRAAEGVVRHIELASGSEGASDGVKTHAVHVAASARNTLERARRMIAILDLIAETEEGVDPAELADELGELAARLIPGFDADGDGTTGWQEGEGGLRQAEIHLGLLKRGEGW